MITQADLRTKMVLSSGQDIIDRLTRNVDDDSTLVKLLYPSLAKFLGGNTVMPADLLYQVLAIIEGARPRLDDKFEQAHSHLSDILRELTADDPGFAETVRVVHNDVVHARDQPPVGTTRGFLGA